MSSTTEATAIIEEEVFERLAVVYRDLLALPEIAKNISSDHIEGTPTRVAKALQELLSGYKVDPATILRTGFRSGKYDEMVHVNDIGFYSLCTHHLLPFVGVVHFAYLPDKRIVGLSKIPRIVEAFARRLQVQEKLTTDIADTFQEIVQPKGCGVVIEAQHMCMAMRGVRKENSITKTTALRGLFLTKDTVKNEFLNAVNHRNGKLL